MKQLAHLLDDFNFECIGTAQTDDENVICESLKHFAAIIGTIEDEREKMVSKSNQAKKPESFHVSKGRRETVKFQIHCEFLNQPQKLF